MSCFYQIWSIFIIPYTFESSLKFTGSPWWFRRAVARPSFTKTRTVIHIRESEQKKKLCFIIYFLLLKFFSSYLHPLLSKKCSIAVTVWFTSCCGFNIKDEIQRRKVKQHRPVLQLTFSLSDKVMQSIVCDLSYFKNVSIENHSYSYHYYISQIGCLPFGYGCGYSSQMD